MKAEIDFGEPITFLVAECQTVVRGGVTPEYHWHSVVINAAESRLGYLRGS